MENLIIELSKYIIIILMTFYTMHCFTVFRYKEKKRQNHIFHIQFFLLYLIQFICYIVLYLNKKDIKLIYFYLIQVFMFVAVSILYKAVYKNLSRLVLNNMLMFLMISFVMLTRLSFELAVKQFTIATVGVFGCLLVPVIIGKFKWLKNFGWIYGAAGLIMLLAVKFLGVKKYGAVNWIKVAGILIQPSEFVKILFVFAIGALLSKSTDFITVIKITVMAALHVLILVWEKDLGGALIFFVTYLIVLYVASGKKLYLFGGLGSGIAASVFAYKLFDHVRIRVAAWKNPWSLIDNEGYQVTQSLFAIGTGGWFGMGLSRGLPGSIPVSESDFIFSAISEELGGLFAICVILICVSCFIMFVNISMKMKSMFYKLVALGLGVMYIFQVFLTIGGVTKFIPSTGVTLPLISYGGSSVLSTLILFAVIQGMYVLNQNEDDEIEKKSKQGIRNSNKRNRTFEE